MATTPPPRIAFFPDSFGEVNGVAHTARNFVSFAQRHGIPMLCVHAGQATERQQGSVTELSLPRSRWSVGLEQDLAFDPFFWRHARRIARALRRFQPTIIHITGPSELGMLGAFFAWRLGLPLAASWHTNVHEYAGRRLKLGSRSATAAVERATFAASARFYRLAKVLYAPNPPLCRQLAAATGRPCHLMQRGVDTTLFTPAKRILPDTHPLRLGYVGRLSVEKNVALLPQIHRQLLSRGLHPHWTIVGHGAEEPHLRQVLGPAAHFTGVLRGEAIAEAYANMDLLVFPSHTDTFGNVVLEALASGVPALVTPDGGPAHIVQPGQTGLIAPDDAFAEAIATLSPVQRQTMAEAARAYALTCSWDAVFERVLAAYPAPATA